VPLPTYAPLDADRTGGVPRPPQPVVPGEVVDVLRRTVAAEPSQGKPRVMIGYADNQLAAQVATQVQRFGFDVVRAETGRAILRRLRDSGDVDLLLLDIDLPDPGFPYLLSQIRAMPQGKRLAVVLTIDVRPGALPRSLEETLRYARDASRKAELSLELLIPAFERANVERIDNDQERAQRALEISAKLAPSNERAVREESLRSALDRENVLVKAQLDRQRAAAQVREDSLRRFLERDTFVSLYPVSLTLDREGLEQVLRQGADTALPEAERKANANEAVKLLGRMARGDLPGYDVRPAEDAVLAALRDNRLSEDATSAAVIVVGHMPTARGQAALEEVLLKPYPERIRLEAGDELVRNLQRNQVLLTAQQADAVVRAFALEKDGPIKVRMGMVVGVINRDPRRTGELLRGFDPLPTKPPVVKPPK
jgi:CheY-like chemotaxis protein